MMQRNITLQTSPSAATRLKRARTVRTRNEDVVGAVGGVKHTNVHAAASFMDVPPHPIIYGRATPRISHTQTHIHLSTLGAAPRTVRIGLECAAVSSMLV